ncbi:MAG: hypothetical protein KatS3mg029_1028 [Saprospiraceae bacterium]|nr:MAG: hypothetical protein KatS3mg029_1028 [Saprospiraceae bacterium]
MHLILITMAIVSCIWAFFLLLPFLLTLAGRFRPERLPRQTVAGQAPDFACIITAWRNETIAEALVESLLRQTWPHFHIYLVNDACSQSNWTIQHERLSVFYPDPALDLKIRSIDYAVQRFVRPHDFVVVFDADNVAHPRFLEEITTYLRANLRAVQGQRRAKNLDTPYACADALGEFYKNWVERYMPWVLGSSAVISGSGMAVETNLYKAYLASPEIQLGQRQQRRMLQEDKILQNFLLRQDERIAWARNAVVYDEKVTSAQSVETQRSRWLFSYFQNVPNAWQLLTLGLRNRSWNQFLFGLVTIAPPMFIQLFGAFALAALDAFVLPSMSLLLLAAVAVFALNILWVLWLSNVPPPVWRSLWTLPGFVFRQMRALGKMRDPDRHFEPTRHDRKVRIDELLRDDASPET